MSPTASGDNGTWSIDASIPDSDDQALTELLICLDGSDGKVPTSLPPGEPMLLWSCLNLPV
ncbi:unnamed protein product [Durusdinium trenchii]|uniref:Uncharacterized protein n=1 Tax=Durusdinium trenchii TaxID=1381693 RepID=A0ABP0R7J2_9DINO